MPSANATPLVLLLIGACVVTALPAAGATVVAVQDGRTKGVIVLRAQPSWLSQHAAEELARYVEKMTDCSLPIVAADSAEARGAANRILLGASFRQLTAFPPPALPYWGDTDAYTIRTTSRGEQNDLIIAGKTDRATLFGVYWFLEEYCGVGFFWDGEYVARVRDLRFTNINVKRVPYFTNREHLQGCAFAYTTDWWSLDDWKRELDWMAWKGFNEVMLPHWKAGEYARKLDIKVMGPDCHAEQLHPHPEQQWQVSPEEMRARVSAEAKALADQLRRSPDPLQHYEVSGWAFTADPWYWNKETTEAYLSQFPKGGLVIWDLWCDVLPMYRLYDYFGGHYWCFGLLHTMGRMNHFHTDIPDLIARAKAVAEDPQAKNCIGFVEMSESIHHNVLLFELAMDLGWDPREVALDGFLARFCRLRYGKSAAPAMAKAWGHLLQSVYRHHFWLTPFYMLGPWPDPNFIDRDDIYPLFDRFQYIKPCLSALHIALRLKDKCRDNPLYTHDVVDMARQLVFELGDYHYIHLLSAYVRQEEGGFRKHLAAVRACLDALQTTLSSDSRYWLQTHVDQLKRVGDPDFNRISAFGEAFDRPTEEEGKRINDLHRQRDWETLVRLRWQQWGYGDYQRTDFYELLQHNYRRRVELFLSGLEQHFHGRGDRYRWREALPAQYAAIVKDWRESPHPMRPAERHQGSAVEAVSEVVAKLEDWVDGQTFDPIAGPELGVGKHVGWQEDFSTVTRWRAEGSVTLDPKGQTVLAKSPTKSFSYSIGLNADLTRFPVLQVRYLPLFHRGNFWLRAEWTDMRGEVHSNLIMAEGGDERWQEKQVHLRRLLGLVGEPARLRRLTVSYPYAGHEVEWDFMRLCSAR